MAVWPLCSRFRMLESRFSSVIGRDAVAKLSAMVAPRPVVCISGHQLTGKSSTVRSLCRRFGAEHLSAGTLFREEAKRRGIQVAELSLLAKENPNTDIQIDYNMCCAIAKGSYGDSSKPLILEGRLPPLMSVYLKVCHNKLNNVNVFIRCSTREQALRYLVREVSPEAAHLARNTIPDRQFGSLSLLAPIITDLPIDDVQAVWERFALNAERDKLDEQRYSELYDFNDGLEYANEDLYDFVVDNSKLSLEDTADAIADYVSFMFPSR